MYERDECDRANSMAMFLFLAVGFGGLLLSVIQQAERKESEMRQELRQGILREIQHQECEQ